MNFDACSNTVQCKRENQFLWSLGNAGSKKTKPWAKHRNNYADAMSVLWLNGACCSWSTCLVRNHKCSHVLLCRIGFHQSGNQYKTQNRTISQRNIISVSFQNQANLCYFLSHPLQENRSITSQIPWFRGWIWLKCTYHLKKTRKYGKKYGLNMVNMFKTPVIDGLSLYFWQLIAQKSMFFLWPQAASGPCKVGYPRKLSWFLSPITKVYGRYVYSL